MDSTPNSNTRAALGHDPDVRYNDSVRRDTGASAAFDPELEHSTQPPTLAGLFGDLWRQTTTLVHQEAALAKSEMSKKISHMALGIGGIAAGGAVIFAGFIILLSAAVNALAPYLPPHLAAWLSPLIVGLVIIIIGYIIYASGKGALDESNLTPTRTVESLRQDGQMVKEHVQ